MDFTLLRLGQKKPEDALGKRFWSSLKKELLPELEAVFRPLFLAGAELGAAVTPVRTKEDLPLDLDAINAAADAVFATYTDDWWEQFSKSTQDQLRAAIVRARDDGTGVEGVIDDLRPIFGPNRASLIATTETTRLFGLGAQATYAAAGIEEWQWQTVRDANVCQICGPLQGTRYPIDQAFEPKHPRCRCFPRPVVPAGEFSDVT